MPKVFHHLLFAVFVFSANAQQDALFTQFWNVQQSFNPAFTGTDYRHEAHAVVRSQWQGVNGAPDSQILTYGARIDNWHSGLGFTYYRDKIGFSVMNQGKLNYAYHLKLNEQQFISFGLSAGVSVYRLEAEWIPPTTVSDPTLPEDELSKGFTSDIGIAYRNNKITAGFGVTHLVTSNYSASYQEAKHYYLSAKYTLGKVERLQVRPQILLRSDLIKISAELNTLFIFKGTYQFGLTYRTMDAIGFTVGYTFRDLVNLSYSYDLTINKLSSISKGSHEIHLGFTLR